MSESDDGLIYRKKALFQETAGDETAFMFERDGSLLAVGRRGRANAQLITGKPPYQSPSIAKTWIATSVVLC